MRTLGHFFKTTDTLENLLGLAAANYELTASIPQVCKYLAQTPWDQIAEHEERLQKVLIDYLNSKPDVITIWGEPVADKRKRVPVISFTVKGRKSRDVVEAIEARSNFGCRWGSFYSNRLCEEVLGLDAVDAVIRVSLVHYNSGKPQPDPRLYDPRLTQTLFFYRGGDQGLRQGARSGHLVIDPLGKDLSQSLAFLFSSCSTLNAAIASRGSIDLALSLSPWHSRSLAASRSARIGSIMRFLLNLTAPGGCAATLLAMPSTSSMKFSLGRIFEMKPALSISCAVIFSPARMREAAFCRPMIR